jgi:hypothetical protein
MTAFIQKFLRGGQGGTVFQGVSATPTHSRSAKCRSFGASSQKFAKKTKFHQVLVKGCGTPYQLRAWHSYVVKIAVIKKAFFFAFFYRILIKIVLSGHF